LAGTVVIVPARMASTRLPGKPLADICGRSLILRVLDGAAEADPLLVAAATDSPEIFGEVRKAGFEAVLTGPAENGTKRVFQAWEILGRPGERIVNLQGDEPGAGAGWINALAGAPVPSMGVSTLVSPMPADKASDPHTVKAVFDREHRALYFSRSPIPWHGSSCHRHIGAYCFTPESLPFCASCTPGPLASAENLEQLSWMENGVAITVVPGEWNGMGVDTPEDLEEARRWFSRR